MKNSLELMKMFTSNRRPSFSYSPLETMKGDVYILSEKQNNWLLGVIYGELKQCKDVPKDWQPGFGTQRNEGDTYYIYTTVKRNRKPYPAVRVATY